MKIAFLKTAPAAGVVIAPQFEDGEPTAGYAALDAQTEGGLSRAAKTANFGGKSGQVVELIGVSGATSGRIILVGAGKRESFSPLDAERLGAAAIAPVLKTQEKSATFALDGFATDAVGAGVAASRAAPGSDPTVSTSTGRGLRRTRSLRSKKSRSRRARRTPRPNTPSSTRSPTAFS